MMSQMKCLTFCLLLATFLSFGLSTPPTFSSPSSQFGYNRYQYPQYMNRPDYMYSQPQSGYRDYLSPFPRSDESYYISRDAESDMGAIISSTPMQHQYKNDPITAQMPPMYGQFMDAIPGGCTCGMQGFPGLNDQYMQQLQQLAQWYEQQKKIPSQLIPQFPNQNFHQQNPLQNSETQKLNEHVLNTGITPQKVSSKRAGTSSTRPLFYNDSPKPFSYSFYYY